MAKPRSTKKEKTEDDDKVKVTVSIPRRLLYRLDVLAAHLSLDRRRKVDRSDLLVELALPHLRSIVISVRGELSGREGADEPIA